MGQPKKIPAKDAVIDCIVLDAGARYGLHPTWAPLRHLAQFHLFEMDPIEAARLQEKYKADSGIKIYPLALFSENTTLEFQVSEHRALNSLFESDDDLLRQNDYMQNAFSRVEKKFVEARTIDDLFQSQPVHFMKLDTEGAEYEILKGAKRTLESSTLGVRSEVLFAPIFKGAPMFGEINALMLSHGFELLNLDYVGAGNKAGRFTMPGRYGKLMSSDAVWVVNSDRLFAQSGVDLARDVVRLAIFMLQNSATDLAIETILRAVQQGGISIAQMLDDPLVQYLHRQILLLFKSLLSLPMLQEADITQTYKLIFNRDFPLLSKFYESDIFS